MDMWMKINAGIILVSLIGLVGYFAWRGFVQWQAEQNSPTASLGGIGSYRKDQMARKSKLDAIRKKYRAQIKRSNISDFFGVTSNLDFEASDAVEKTEGNVIFVDFKAKKKRAS